MIINSLNRNELNKVSLKNRNPSTPFGRRIFLIVIESVIFKYSSFIGCAFDVVLIIYFNISR